MILNSSELVSQLTGSAKSTHSANHWINGEIDDSSIPISHFSACSEVGVAEKGFWQARTHVRVKNRLWTTNSAVLHLWSETNLCLNKFCRGRLSWYGLSKRYCDHRSDIKERGEEKTDGKDYSRSIGQQRYQPVIDCLALLDSLLILSVDHSALVTRSPNDADCSFTLTHGKNTYTVPGHRFVLEICCPNLFLVAVKRKLTKKGVINIGA